MKSKAEETKFNSDVFESQVFHSFPFFYNLSIVFSLKAEEDAEKLQAAAKDGDTRAVKAQSIRGIQTLEPLWDALGWACCTVSCYVKMSCLMSRCLFSHRISRHAVMVSWMSTMAHAFWTSSCSIASTLVPYGTLIPRLGYRQWYGTTWAGALRRDAQGQLVWDKSEQFFLQDSNSRTLALTFCWVRQKLAFWSDCWREYVHICSLGSHEMITLAIVEHCSLSIRGACWQLWESLIWVLQCRCCPACLII